MHRARINFARSARCTFLFAVVALGVAAGPLRYAEDRAPAVINPIFATSMSEARIDELVFEGLFTDDHELRSRPDLAETWTLAADRRSMTIELTADGKEHLTERDQAMLRDRW